MEISGNTILITGGATGIGRGLAEAFTAEDNQVIIASRRKDELEAVTAANPGMASIELDVTDPHSIAAAAASVLRDHPDLNVVINDAGIMKFEELTKGEVDVADATVATNLMGPIRVTAAFMRHLLAQSAATIINVSAGTAFVPMSVTPTYNATKAALHNYSESLREQLKDTSVQVLEIIPPAVQSTLLVPEGATDKRAMPVADYIGQVMAIIRNGADREVAVEAVLPLRLAEKRGNYDEMFAKNNAFFG